MYESDIFDWTKYIRKRPKESGQDHIHSLVFIYTLQTVACEDPAVAPLEKDRRKHACHFKWIFSIFAQDRLPVPEPHGPPITARPRPISPVPWHNSPRTRGGGGGGGGGNTVLQNLTL